MVQDSLLCRRSSHFDPLKFADLRVPLVPEVLTTVQIILFKQLITFNIDWIPPAHMVDAPFHKAMEEGVGFQGSVIRRFLVSRFR